MKVVLHPRVATGDRVRVWIGVFGITGTPELQWQINDVPATPKAVQGIESVRPPRMVVANEARAYAGVYEFGGAGIQAGRSYRVRVEAACSDGLVQTSQIGFRTLPEQVPWGPTNQFNVLLVSCFHRAKDRVGHAGNLVEQLARNVATKPDMALLLGDQVYLDLPLLGSLRGLRKLSRKFEDDYRRNWTEKPGFAQILAAAPWVAIPDDHEYWNNYPHAATVIPNSWAARGRKDWRQVAKRMYTAFQLPQPCRLGDPVVFEVPPLSFFLMDTRTMRHAKRDRVLSGASLAAFEAWVGRVAQEGLFGVVASGQPLLATAAGKVKGGIVDYTMPDYGDYPSIVRQLARLANGGRPFLLLTGDVHWGRVTKGTDRELNGGGRGFYEVISSPASLVASIGKDQVRTIWGGVKARLGRPDPFPRHSKPKEPPEFLAKETLQKRFECKRIHGQKGNHVALLSFRRMGFGLELDVTYWPIHRGFNLGESEKIGPLQLKPA